MPSPSLSPRPVFDPYAAAASGVGVGAAGWRAVPGALLGFYRDRLSWLALGVTSAVLCYIGGLVMFWFHAVELDEGGPAISWYAHWMLDSTFAFVALTPALALIIPMAVAWSTLVAGPGRPHAIRWSYAVIAGGLFAVATTPGPIAHDLIVGRGTWVAERVTAWIGDPSAPLTPVAEYPLSAALTQQLGAGVALYMLLALLSMLVVRRAVGAAQRRAPARNEGAAAGVACND
jgi:hypothetical protein